MRFDVAELSEIDLNPPPQHISEFLYKQHCVELRDDPGGDVAPALQLVHSRRAQGNTVQLFQYNVVANTNRRGLGICVEIGGAQEFGIRQTLLQRIRRARSLVHLSVECGIGPNFGSSPRRRALRPLCAHPVLLGGHPLRSGRRTLSGPGRSPGARRNVDVEKFACLRPKLLGKAVRGGLRKHSGLPCRPRRIKFPTGGAG